MKRRILVIDDDPVVSNLVACWLRASGYETVLASNGQEGILLAKSVRLDLIILDFLLPDISAIKLRDRLLVDSAKDIPIMLMTAYKGGIEERARRCGAVASISKPVDKEELLDKVGVCLKDVVGSSFGG